MRKKFCTCENFSFFQKSRKYAQNAMKTAIFSQFFINEKRVFSQFFINEKRVFSQFFINEKRVFSFNESHKNALRNAVFLMRGMLIFWMSFIWIFFLLPMSFNNQLKMTKN